MNFELVEQTIQYTFMNDKYGQDGFKKRVFKYVKPGVAAESLAKVGKAIAGLQKDELGDAALVQKHIIPLVQE